MPTRRQLFARSCRRSLVWGLGFFVLFQLLLALTLELWWTSGRDPLYGAKIARLRSRLRQSPNARLVVMLGSSRTGDGFRAASLEPELAQELGQPLILFNFGMSAAAPCTQLLQLQRLLAEGIKPDLVLFEILPVLLDDQQGCAPQRLPPERLSWRDVQQVRSYPFSTHSLRQAWREARAFPWYAHRFNLVSLIWPTLLPLNLRQDGYVRCDGCGWSAPAFWKLSPEQHREAIARTIKGYQEHLEDFQLGSASPEAVRRTLKECRRHNIQAALVLMPEGPVYRSLYGSQVWPQVDSFLDRLQLEFGVPLVNARTWIEEEGFFDSHHLIPDAAAQFTERLGREAILPLLR